MFWLGLDFETTGLDPEKDRVTEIGAVVWDVKKKQPVEIFNALVKSDVPVSPEAEAVSGISNEMLDKWGIPSGWALGRLFMLAEECDRIVAHNGKGFDKPFLEEECKRNNIEWPTNLWFDTMTDIPYGEEFTSKKLVYLAADHGFLNPFSHRAVFDVLTMLRVMSHYDVENLLEYADSPEVTVRAMVSFDTRQKAKDRSYRWNPESKIWTKDIKQCELDKEIAEADFEVRVIEK